MSTEDFTIKLKQLSLFDLLDEMLDEKPTRNSIKNPKICAYCGITFYAKRDKRACHFFCSRQCFFDFYRGTERPAVKGKPSWNNGLTAETDERIHRVAESLKKNVVDRDTLQKLYVEQNIPIKAIGAIYGVTFHVIKRLVTEFGLQRLRETIDEQTLKKLYIEQKLTTGEIGEMFKCSDGFIKTLLDRFGIPARKSKNFARVEVDPEELRRLYHDEHLNYYQIAEILNVDFTSIPYWLKKFGFGTRTVWESRRPKGWQDPDIEVILHLYLAENLGSQGIGDIFGVSNTYIQKQLRENGVILRKPGYPNVSQYTAKDGHRVKSGMELQVDNWLYEHEIAHTYEPALGSTRYKGDFLVRDNYIEIWGIEGNEHYDKKREKKMEVYTSLSLKLISVYRRDFPGLNVLRCLIY